MIVEKLTIFSANQKVLLEDLKNTVACSQYVVIAISPF